MTKRALALDLGSSSVRAIVFETARPREVVPVPGALARRPRHLVSSEPGQATFDADDYLADLVACIDELHSKGALEGVSDICLDSQWHSVMAIGPGGRPLTDVVSWADTRPRRPWPATTPAELRDPSPGDGLRLRADVLDLALALVALRRSARPRSSSSGCQSTSASSYWTTPRCQSLSRRAPACWLPPL